MKNLSKFNRTLATLFALFFIIACQGSGDSAAHALHVPTLHTSVSFGADPAGVNQFYTPPFTEQSTMMSYAAAQSESAVSATSDSLPSSEVADTVDASAVDDIANPDFTTTSPDIVLAETEAAADTSAPADPANQTTPADPPAPETVDIALVETPIPIQPLLDIPLDAETQYQLYEGPCKSDPQIFSMMMAIAERESDFNTRCVGDHGLSLGMFQVKTDCHQARLAYFGLSNNDLYDPYNGCVVALDYLYELMETQGISEPCHYLFMSYNAGPSRAKRMVSKGKTSTEYSEDVMAHYETYYAALQAAGIA